MCFFHPAYAQHDNRITIGTVENIYSNVLHEDRQVWVHMPDTSGSFYGTARYPVVYLLDGDAHFPAVAGIMQFLSETNSIIPKMILVGIPNTDRMRDLTPSHDRTVPKDSNMMRTTGGGENFIAFIEKELMPYINAHYPAAPYSVLIGHSLGGLLVVHTLLNHSNLFNAYIALDPSLFWDNQKTLREGMDAFSRSDYKNRSLFMASSEGLPAGTDTAAIEQDTAMATIVIRPVLKFDRAVKASSANGLSYRWQCYPQESHATLPLPATYDGLRFTFAFAQLPPVKRDTVTTDFYKHHYQAVSRKMGYTFLPPSDLVKWHWATTSCNEICMTACMSFSRDEY